MLTGIQKTTLRVLCNDFLEKGKIYSMTELTIFLKKNSQFGKSVEDGSYDLPSCSDVRKFVDDLVIDHQVQYTSNQLCIVRGITPNENSVE